MNNNRHSIDYICTHLGEENVANENFGAISPPIYETSLHVFQSIEEMLGFNAAEATKQYVYGRVENPTTQLLEMKLAALEHADGTLCFGSGMAAISAAILHCVRPGDHIVSLHNAYGPAKEFMSNYLKGWGVEVTFVDGKDPQEFEQAARPNTKLFYLESPSSLVLELQDLRAVSAIAKSRGIKTAIDNTWATPILQNPLDLGIDISLHTMSKYIGGHSDIIGGALCANAEIIASIKTKERELIGGILGPFESWLAIRGLRTMPLRVEKSGSNALAVAKLLESSSRVRRVNYPGIDSYPQRELAKAQMRGSTGLLSFELDATVEQTKAFANHLQMFRKGVSWGGFESLVCLPMIKATEEEAASRNTCRTLVRLYCGVESEQDLLDDVASALRA